MNLIKAINNKENTEKLYNVSKNQYKESIIDFKSFYENEQNNHKDWIKGIIHPWIYGLIIETNESFKTKIFINYNDLVQCNTYEDIAKVIIKNYDRIYNMYKLYDNSI